MGSVLGSFITINTEGLDFVLTALFVVLFIEQMKKKEKHVPGIIGIICSFIALVVFGADNLVIPAMVMVLVCLLLGRRKLQ